MSLVNTAPCNTFAVPCISFCFTCYEFDTFAFMNFCSSHAKYFDLSLHSPLTLTSLLHNLRVTWFPQVHSRPRWSLHALGFSFLLLCSDIHSPPLPPQMYQDYDIRANCFPWELEFLCLVLNYLRKWKCKFIVHNSFVVHFSLLDSIHFHLIMFL